MRKTIIALSLLLSTNAFANPLWEDVKSPVENTNKLSRSALPLYSARLLKLDENALRQQLLSKNKPSIASMAAKDKLLVLPLPDGSMVDVIAKEYALLSPELAAKFPDIKTWKVHAANGKNIHGRIDLTDSGFHAMLILENGDTIFIDPKKSSNNKLYNSFSKKDNKPLFQRHSLKKEHLIRPPIPQKRANKLQSKNNRTARPLITYRLALSATGEYVKLRGGTKKNALNAMATTINRVNEIYERDLAIQLSLVANTDKIIYTNEDTDPYTNGDAYTMVDETIATIDAIIGDSNYDIGHLFGGDGTGGLALLSGACRANKISHKAGGITGSASPYGDSFDIDYVAHEIGHQLGATHTFNSETLNCGGNNREPDTAVEPGSGSTIMSYAGICGTNNLQKNSDAVFNTVSIAQIDYYLRDSGEANCGTKKIKSNNNPNINATSSYYIPTNTPFILTSNAHDIDGDSLSYTWDEIDTNGTAVDVGLDTGDNPLFRSRLPTSKNYRYFPRVETLFSGYPVKGEMLAVTNRALNFATTVRDNKGGIAREDTKIITSGNAFSLISHSTARSYKLGDVVNVSWDKASTNLPPINCKSVDIKLLAKDGNTQNLLINTPNDGQQSFIISNYTNTISQARLMVACSDNIFFAVSKGNISIMRSEPTISINSPSIIEGDTGNKILNYIIKLSSASDKDASVKYIIRDAISNQQVQNGIVNIPAGKISANIYQTIEGNFIKDNDRKYYLTLYSPINIQFDSENTETLKTTGTVIDNDNKVEDPEDKSVVNNSNKKSAGSMGSILVFLMLYLSLLKLRVKARRAASA